MVIPTTTVEDIFVRQGMIWAAANLTETLGIEAFYQYDWKKAKLPPIGWFLSGDDLIGNDRIGVGFDGFGMYSDQGTDLDAAFDLPAGTLGFDKEFMLIPSAGRDKPSSQGQFGVTLQTFVSALNSAKIALHFMNYHSRLPLISGRTADAEAVAGTTNLAVDARAAELAERYGAVPFALNDLPEQLSHYDIVVSCTASPLPILGKGMIERGIKARRHRPMLMIDLAVPRDIEAEAADLDDVFLYTVDDLGKIVQEGLGARQAAVEQAEAIISAGVGTFMHWLDSREAVPTIRAFRDQTDRMRRREIERALAAIERGDDPKKVLEQFSQALTNKFLHAPTSALNQAEAAERTQLMRALAHLHRIDLGE